MKFDFTKTEYLKICEEAMLSEEYCKLLEMKIKGYTRQCHYSKTIEEFVEEHPHGVYLCTMIGHITCIIDGCIYDTFNCSDRIMRCAWKIE